MGDSRRNKVFAHFIKNNFPKVKTILVVADGLGDLSACLMTEGFSVRTVEAKMRDKRKRAKGVKFTRAWFSRNDDIKEDLLVAMHPDEATAEVVLAARKNKKPFAVVPCCIVGPEALGVKGFDSWIRKLTHLSGGECRVSNLPITGQNLVLYRRGDEI